MDATLVAVALITALPATIAATAAFLVTLRNGKKVDLSIERMDGRLTELLAASIRAATSEATAAEKAVGVDAAAVAKAAADQAVIAARMQGSRRGDAPKV